eukprot:TRINITY_DN5645_c0_g2_i1.p1 TRINITY_DN5645_c0_g2~~TRINITY_DN5645_c0_g2_i1.p1  ORF type:complete len:625 (-),score=73.06 TRINITY_DN5645_c0_g2_i1:261-2135(-)
MGDFRSIVRRRLLDDMLKSLGGTNVWRVLVLDDLTTKIISSCCKMGELTIENNISVVEDLKKGRQPLPELEAIYFISPSSDSVERVKNDFARSQKYKAVHIFFSSRVDISIIAQVKTCPPLVKALKTLREADVEFLTWDPSTFLTDQPTSLRDVFGSALAQDPDMQKACIDVMARRLLTAFLSLRDYPTRIRYRAPWIENSDMPGHQMRSTAAKNLAYSLVGMARDTRQTRPEAFQNDCDVLILDRGYDPVAPVYHDFFYQPMVHDLVDMDGKLYRYKMDQGDEVDVLLDVEADSVWRDLRFTHVSKVTKILDDRIDEVKATSKFGKEAKDIKDLKKLTEGLPEYRETMRLFGIHIDIVSKLLNQGKERDLPQFQLLEEDLVLEQAGQKDIIDYFNTDAGRQTKEEDKLRLLMVYYATNLGRFDNKNKGNWMVMTSLKDQHMRAIENMQYLGVPVFKSQKSTGGMLGSLGLNARGGPKKARSMRRRQDEEFSTLQPCLAELVEDLVGKKMNEQEFPLIELQGSYASTSGADIKSVRSKQTKPSWTKKSSQWASQEGGDGGIQRRRVIVFVIGGITNNEILAAYEASQKLEVDVILGSTDLLRPEEYIYRLQECSTAKAFEIGSH